MKRHIHTALLYLLVALLFVVAHGCAAIKSAGYTIAGGAGGAAIGAVAGGPIGAAVGGGIGAFAGAEFGQNDELRNGTLVGDEALKKENERLTAELSSTKNKVVATTDALMSTGDELATLWKWAKIAPWIIVAAFAASHYLHHKLNKRKATT